jgi:endoglucanase
MQFDERLFRDLCLTPGPSGHEQAVQRLIRSRLEAFGRCRTDPLGNLWFEIGSEAHDGADDTIVPHILVTAHADQVAFVLSYVDERGYLWFESIGWVDPLVLPGAELVVRSAGGPVPGVVGTRPPHLDRGKERAPTPELHDLCLDIGEQDREASLRRVAVGDPITFAPRFITLADSTYASIACDNRAGVYAVLRLVEELAAGSPETTSKLGAKVEALFTVQEETAFTGAKAAARRSRPDVVVVVDGDFATDHPGMDPKSEAGLVALGRGPVVARGTGTTHELYDLVTQVASEEGVPLQVRAAPGAMLTDADELMACGAAVLSLSIPMRYVHAPLEVVNAGDIVGTVRLLAALVRRLAAGRPAPRTRP